MLVAGIDEAGRGCVVGPLVIAGVLIADKNLHILNWLGVKDSKMLSPKKREFIAAEIVHLAEKHVTVKVTPKEIDRVVESNRRMHKLNRLEAETMAQIISVLKPDDVYVDAADVNEERFKHHIQESLTVKTKITSRHKSDKIYPIVSAASIIAKVERDKEIAALKAIFGDFGSGYLTDQKTTLFLKNWLRVHPEYPDCVRKSWKPAKQAKSERGTLQKKLV
jgi:ribonuclease HII